MGGMLDVFLCSDNTDTLKLFGNINEAVTLFCTSIMVLFLVCYIKLFYLILSMRKLAGKTFLGSFLFSYSCLVGRN